MIQGLTDQVVLRRDGKIRAGTRTEGSNFPKNLPHFLLHDAPQLIPKLGETPDEIFFTVHSDNLAQFFRDDLRWYNANRLICKSMHGYKDPNTSRDMGSVSAFFEIGQEVSGLTQNPFPGIARAFERRCAYKACPNYVIGTQCSEHLFLDMVIPQYSMGAIFTLDSTSINAVLNLMSGFQKAYFRYQGKFSGQIFRLYKKKADINFPDKNGKQVKRPTDVVHLDNVSFAEYEERFKSQIDPVDWDALMFWRSGGRQSSDDSMGRAAFIPASNPSALLEAGDPELAELANASPQLESSLMKAGAATTEDAIEKRANDPGVAPLFADISGLLGKENSLEARLATAKQFPDVTALANYLKGRIRDLKKAKKEKAGPVNKQATPPKNAVETTSEKVATPAQVSPPPTQKAVDPLSEDPLY